MNDIRELANLIILGRTANIECLIVYEIPRCMQRGNVGARYVFYVHDRSPWAAITFQINLLGRKSPRGQVINNQIKSDAWRKAVRSRCSQEDRREILVSELRYVSFNIGLGLAVRCNRTEFRVLVQKLSPAAP